MVNPWEKISLSDYENHMKLDSVVWNILTKPNSIKYTALILTENTLQQLRNDIKIFLIYWNVYS